MYNFSELIDTNVQVQQRLNEVKKFQNKWEKSGLLEGLSNENEKGTLSVLLENQGRQLFKEGNVTNMGSPQSTYTAGYGDQWSGIALPLVRRSFGKIVSKDFLAVQPMSMPVGLVFWLDFKYGTEKFSHKAGESVMSMGIDKKSTDLSQGLYGAGRFGFSLNHFSASVTATSSSVSFADVNYDADFKTFANYVKLTIPTAGLTDFDPQSTRAFVLASGSVDTTDVHQQFTKYDATANTLTFIVNAPAATGTYLAYFTKQTKDSQRGDFEDRANFSVPNANSASTIVLPEMEIEMKSESISAGTRKLKTKWTWEMAQDMDAFQNLDAEAELTSLMSNYIAREIDLELLDMMIAAAPVKNTEYWSCKNNTVWNGSGFDAAASVGAGGFYNDQGTWFQTLGTKLQKVSNNIGQLTLQGGANFMVISPKISTVIESIPGFAGDSAGDQDLYNFGVQKIGALNSRYKVYKMPYITENLIFLGYKGAGFTEAGAVYAPYVPLISTPTVHDPETFTPAKAIMTRYAKKVMRGEFYGKIYVADLDVL
jgi:hypothetical protein